MHFTPSLSNAALYYTVVICSPFVSQRHLVLIRNYLQQVSTEMENRIASNPVPPSQSIPSPSSPSHSPSITQSPESLSEETYKRMTATLPKDFSLFRVCNKHNRVQIIISDHLTILAFAFHSNQHNHLPDC